MAAKPFNALTEKSVLGSKVNAEKKTESATMMENEALWRALTEHSPDHIMLLDKKAKILFMNHTVPGLTRDQIIGTSFYDYALKEYKAVTKKCFKQVLETGESCSFESSYRNDNGIIQYFESQVGPVKIGDRIVGLTVSSRDISERRQAEVALKESEERFRDIAHNAHEWIWEVDTSGKYTYVSPVVKKILGYEPEEVLGKFYYDFFHPDRRKDLIAKTSNNFANQKSFRNFINWNQDKNGKKVVLLTSGVPIFDPEGNFTGYRGADTDITDLYETKNALKETDEHVNSLMKSASGFVVFRLVENQKSPLKLKFVFISPSEKEILGFPDSMNLESWFDYIHPNDVASIAENQKKALKTFRFDEKFRIYNPQKEEWRWVHAIVTGGTDDKKWNGYANGIIIDITETQITKEELMKSREHLQSLLENASGFAVYRMIYDEDTPYNLKIVACSPSFEKLTGFNPEKTTVRDLYKNVHPDDAEGLISAHNEAFSTGNFDHVARLFNPIKSDYVWLHAISSTVKNDAGQITHVNGLIIDVTEKQNVKIKLIRSYASLRKQTEKQRELNTALNVLLKKRDRDKLELEQSIMLNIKEMVTPYVKRLCNSKLSDDQKTLLELIDSNLKEITSKLTMKLSIPQLGLSPAEIKVANYVKLGKNSKEIASLLGLSFKTVKNQRNSIRKKLGITGKKINLRNYLLVLDKEA